MITLISLIVALLTINPSNTANETRNVDAFMYVDVAGSITVNLIPSDEHKVDIEMLRGDSEDLITEVRSNTLKLKFKSKGFNWNGSNKNKARIDVYYRSLEGISASAGSSVKSDNEVVADNMEIDVSSGASVKVGFEVRALEVDVSSGGSVKLEGETERQHVEVSSGASYTGTELKSQECSVEASSGASAKVWVERDFEADASSGATIKYKGDPKNRDIDAGKYSGGSVREM